MKRLLLIAFVMFMAVLCAEAQVKIQSPSRDIDVKMRKCQSEGENVLIEFLLTNNGEKDIKNVFYASAAFPSTAHDDEGGSYKLEYGSLAGEAISSFTHNCKATQLPVGVPVRCALLVDNVDPNAAMFSLIRLNIYLDGSLKPLLIRNLPINKD